MDLAISTPSQLGYLLRAFRKLQLVRRAKEESRSAWKRG